MKRETADPFHTLLISISHFVVGATRSIGAWSAIGRAHKGEVLYDDQSVVVDGTYEFMGEIRQGVFVPELLMGLPPVVHGAEPFTLG